MLAQQERCSTRGFLWLCAGLHPEVERPYQEVCCQAGMQRRHCGTQLTPAGHETGVLPGVLPRLDVVLVFPTQAQGS